MVMGNSSGGSGSGAVVGEAAAAQALDLMPALRPRCKL